MATVKENLIAARALIDTPEKWGKGTDVDYLDPSGCQCVMTAVKWVAGTDKAFNECRDALRSVMPEGWRGLFTLVSFYNDDPDTTHPDILALFDRAIEAAP